MKTSVLDSGHRERQCLLAFWDANEVSALGNGARIPFHRYLSIVTYDSETDTFLLPDGITVPVKDCYPMLPKHVAAEVVK